MAVEDVTWRVALSDITLGDEEEQAVLEVLRSRWLTMGPKTAAFEAQFAAAVGSRHAVAVSNGTASLHLALLAVGVGPGDEVIVPALTFVATANAVLYCGARPVFADIVGQGDLLLDPQDVQRKITPRTRAVMPVHYGGYACDMDALSALATEHGFRLVEDAAHAPGSTWRGRPIGSTADLSSFSFFGNKNLVTGEGGMITTQDDALAGFVRLYRSHGMTALSYDKHRGHAFTYDVVGHGYNYRLTEIESALGIVQLSRLPASNALRRQRVADYRRELEACPGVEVPFAGRDDQSSCHIFVVVLPEGTDRPRLQQALKAEGIQTSVHYPPVHRFSAFHAKFPAEVPRTEALAPRLLTLPLHPRMTRDDVAHVCRTLKRALDSPS